MKMKLDDIIDILDRADELDTEEAVDQLVEEKDFSKEDVELLLDVFNNAVSNKIAALEEEQSLKLDDESKDDDFDKDEYLDLDINDEDSNLFNLSTDYEPKAKPEDSKKGMFDIDDEETEPKSFKENLDSNGKLKVNLW